MIFEQDGLKYELSTNDHSAKIVGFSKMRDLVCVPRSVIFESHEYIIKSISKNSFMNNKVIRSIEFVKDSEILSIDEDAFIFSLIEKISIPPSLCELKEGWCSVTPSLKNISISPQNKNFILFNNDMILGKSNLNSEVFDILVFASRNITKAKIPSYIKRICSYSFNSCVSLESIEFSEKSELVSIGRNAFVWCSNLKKIEIPNDSILQIIEKEAFAHSAIKSISIPPSLRELKDGWCGEASRLCEVFISHDSKNLYYDNELLIGKSNASNENYDTILFAKRDIEKVTIPSYIKYINSFSFEFCSNLESIEFSEDSELLSIGEGAFSYSSLSRIFIPSKVEKLKEGWCKWMPKLKDISISDKNLNFKMIEGKMIVGKSDLKSENFDTLIYANRIIENLNIPDYIKYISAYSFSNCRQLKSIDLSRIESIGECSFACSSIEKIKMSSEVKIIGKKTFMWCKNLQKIEFPLDSKIQTIETKAFSFTSLVSISIPSTVKKIGDDPFFLCYDLHAIEFLSDNLSIGKIGCKNIFVVSFPNAKFVSIDRNELYVFPFNCSFFFSVGCDVFQ